MEYATGALVRYLQKKIRNPSMKNLRKAKSTLSAARRYKAARGIPNKRNVVYKFVRHVYQTNALDVGSTGSGCSLGLSFQGLQSVLVDRLNGAGVSTSYTINVPGASDFPTLFDEYRISKVIVKFVPRVTAQTEDAYNTTSVPAGGAGAVTTAAVMPNMMTSVDDDSGAALSRTLLSQFGNTRIALMDKILTYTFSPKLKTDAILSSTGYNSKAVVSSKTWVDTTSPDARYEGFHAHMQAYPYATCDMNISIVYEFKGVV